MAAMFATSTYSQTPVIEWQKSLGGTSEETLTCVRQTADGGYILTGFAKSTNGDVEGNHGQYDGWVIKLGALGDIQWKKTYGGSLTDYFNEIIPTSDGGYIAIGTTNSINFDVTSNAGLNDIWVVKMEAQGNIQWQKTYGGTATETGISIRATADNGYIISGSTNSQTINAIATGNRGGSDSIIIKIDGSGTIAWLKTYGGNGNDFLRQIIVTDDGGYAFINITTTNNNGDVTDFHGNQNIWVVKTDGSGTIQWQKTVGTSMTWGYSITQTADHGFAVVGDDSGSFSDSHGSEDAIIAKFSEQGILEWRKCYGGSQSDSAVSIIQTTDGGYVFSGYTESNNGDVTANHGTTDMWVVKTSATGELQWQKALGGAAGELSYSIAQTSDEGFVLTGYTRSSDGDVTTPSGGLRNGWVVKLSAEILATSSFKSQSVVVYPNPVTNQFNLQLPNINIETIKIIDITGKTILEQTQNNNSVNTQSLSCGIYFLEAISGNQIYRTKFIKQ